MSDGPECPSCAETEALRGEQAGDGIRVSCLSCGTSWMRGAPTCRSCGGVRSTTRPQDVARTPRGNQVAVVGRRHVVLCPRCDAAVIDPDQRPNSPVPEGYVSRFMFGEPRPTPAHARDADALPLAPPAGDEAASERPVATAAPVRTPPGTPARQPADPTVRQAIETFLAEEGQGADSLVLLLLGRHLGPSQRVRMLDEPEQMDSLEAWFEQTWGSQPDGRSTAARAALGSVLGFWRRRGWLADRE